MARSKISRQMIPYDQPLRYIKKDTALPGRQAVSVKEMNGMRSKAGTAEVCLPHCLLPVVSYLNSTLQSSFVSSSRRRQIENVNTIALTLLCHPENKKIGDKLSDTDHYKTD